MIKNSTNDLYTGITDNPQRRISEHNSKRGALMTEPGNFTIVFLEQYETQTEARKREIQIKNWRRDKKEFLIQKYSQNLQTKL